MFSFFSNKTTHKLTVNDGRHAVNIEAKETILLAALRSGMAIPNSCRVGACASCKCKLIKGKVKELTQSAYVLTADELEQGYILACQSVPKSDVQIEVQLDESQDDLAVSRFYGVIKEQQPLTHNITRLSVTLDQPIAYKAGQYAQLCIPSMSSTNRAYSFATPNHANQVEFYIKNVDGGQLSPVLSSQNLLNTKIELQGPFGDFYLRDSSAAMVCIAGGSGLAPIKAVLQQGLKDGVKRDVVLYFAARTQQDLYCIEDILAIKNQWHGHFAFIPVLSAEPQESNWQGKRGSVTQILSQEVSGLEHAYLCGPPLMIDAAIAILKRRGVSSSHIHFDKFISKADLVAA